MCIMRAWTLRMPRNQFQEILQVKGFWDKVDHISGGTGNCPIVSRYCDHRCARRRYPLISAQKGPTVHDGHPHVKDDQVYMLASHDVESDGAILCNQHRITLIAE